MNTTRFPYISVSFTMDASPLDPNAMERSALGKAAFACCLERSVAQLDHSVTKSDDLGEIWSSVAAREGEYIFEIATSLPYYLPTADNKPDYIVRLDDIDYFVSSRIVRAHYGDGFAPAIIVDDVASPEARLNAHERLGGEYYLAHARALPNLREKLGSPLHVAPLKTYISRRMRVRAATAAEAIEANFLAWRDAFLADVSRLIEACRLAKTSETKSLFPLPGLTSFTTFWIFVHGQLNGDDHIGCEQFAADAGKNALRPLSNISREDIDAALTAGSMPSTRHSVEVALGLARTFCHHGFLDLSIVQLCVATESALLEAFKTHALARGAPPGQFEDLESGITFSQLLNIHLFLICAPTKQASLKNATDRLNWARKRRNEAVHAVGRVPSLTALEVEQALDAAERIVDAVLPRPARPARVDQAPNTSPQPADEILAKLIQAIETGAAHELAYSTLSRLRVLNSGKFDPKRVTEIKEGVTQGLKSLGLTLIET